MERGTVWTVEEKKVWTVEEKKMAFCPGMLLGEELREVGEVRSRRSCILLPAGSTTRYLVDYRSYSSALASRVYSHYCATVPSRHGNDER